MSPWRRFARYNVVGVAGAALQLSILAALVHVVKVDYRIAMMVALFLALAHNFAWHARWTWGDRRPAGLKLVAAFGRFIGGNGLVSLVSTVVLMPLLVDGAHLRPVVANVMTIAAGGLINFWLAGRVVFTGSSRTAARRRSRLRATAGSPSAVRPSTPRTRAPDQPESCPAP
jgi:putative flippase GtrA